MDFVQPGGVTLAAVEVPSGSYPGTDFTSAFFNVSVHRSLTAAECDQFALLSQSEAGPVPPSKVKVGAVEFAEMEDASAQLIKQTDAKYYHMFENGACYEFALGVGTAGDAAEDGSKPVDRDEVFRKLEKILATVKIKSAPVPQVAASGPAQTDTGNKQENQ